MSIYQTLAKGTSKDVELELSSPNKDSITVTPPPEFNGPEDKWSPEDLFSSSISTCFLLTFKALSKHKKLEWEALEVEAHAKLEKTSTGLKFTDVEIKPILTVCCTNNIQPYLELLEKSKSNCLVTSSMNCNFTVTPKIRLKTVRKI